MGMSTVRVVLTTAVMSRAAAKAATQPLLGDLFCHVLKIVPLSNGGVLQASTVQNANLELNP